MKAYSLDLRQRIIATVDRGGLSQKEVAARFAVTARFIRKLLAQRRELGHIGPLGHGGGRRRLFGEEDLERLRVQVKQKPDATLNELRRKVHPQGRRRVLASRWTISRALKAMGYTRKKEDLRSRRSRPGGACRLLPGSATLAQGAFHLH